MLSIALHLSRLTMSSDSVAQQSVVVTWFRVGHGTTYLRLVLAARASRWSRT